MKDYMQIHTNELSTRFAFTLLRPTPEKLSYLLKLPNLRLYFYGMEKAPNSGLIHYQGYLELERPEKPFRLKYLLGNHYYVEAARESVEQNLIYCKKSGAFVHYNLSKLQSSVPLDILN